ncbi:endostatin-like outer membrane protein LenE [Leptospira kirschneri]|uniref:PF07588 family protein n=1 Tax=Leptospira kirschneri serovar Bulgarica str. Nikolaevo TaxID=1240687 RepID=M6F5T2_9LEPT|nr:DUF1554 domain-containing protein [Leptospira kirschneri]EMK24138.1 PF07588 family protein [Leptospira kirschneri serovar Bulgarica str. Nikolaevo]
MYNQSALNKNSILNSKQENMFLFKKIPFFLIFSYMLLACNSEGLDSNLPLLTDSTKNEILNLLNPHLHSSSALLEEFGTLFVAPGFHNGGFSYEGISAADEYCNANIPAGSFAAAGAPYKALLANNLPNYYKRVATVTPNAGDGQENWILKPNTEYRRVDGVTKVMTTNSVGLFDFTNENLTNPFTSTFVNIWTGLNPDWTTRSLYTPTSEGNCIAWVLSIGEYANIVYGGTFGVANMINSHAIFDNFATCDSTAGVTSQGPAAPLSILCVGQKVQRNYKFLFVTPTAHNGDWGGVSGADAYCQANIPTSIAGTGPYKAMLVAPTRRQATVNPNVGDGQIDWVFKPNTEYRRADGITKIMTTNSKGLFDFSKGSLTNSFEGSVDAYIWTGLYSDWRTVATYSEMCHDVPRFGLTTDTSGWEGNGNSGRLGNTKSITSRSISHTTDACTHKAIQFSTTVTINFGILCVEQ